jgi:hypothetical protein
MHFIKHLNQNKKTILLILILNAVQFSFSQNKDSTQVSKFFSGSISATNNGISLVPTFSLGDPAAIFLFKAGKGKFTFEPDMRFALEGKPWSFLFWFRYKAIQNEKFSFRIGAHPALNFRTITVISDGVEKEIIESRRFLAAELAPEYKLTKNINLGLYYLYSLGLDDSAKHNHFFVINSAFNNLHLSKNLYLNVSPQTYYLKQDDLDGFYAVTFISLHKENFPFSLSTILNKAIETDILPEKDFVWNVSLTYSF